MIYVDRLPTDPSWGRWAGGAHMLGTDLDELHAVARRLGLRLAWFQDDATFAHYDLTASKRRQVLTFDGVVEIESGALPDDVLMRRPDGSYEPRHARAARRAKAAMCWDCGDVPVEREGYLCAECDARGADIANGSLAADRQEAHDMVDGPLGHPEAS